MEMLIGDDPIRGPAEPAELDSQSANGCMWLASGPRGARSVPIVQRLSHPSLWLGEREFGTTKI